MKKTLIMVCVVLWVVVAACLAGNNAAAERGANGYAADHTVCQGAGRIFFLYGPYGSRSQ